MKQNSNSRKLNEQMREVVASIILDEISDPRLFLITVTGAEVSSDRSVASVFVAAGPDRYDEVLAGLESAKGRIRSLLGHALGWRVTPELRFFIDDTVDASLRMSEALKHVPPTLAAEREHGSDAEPSADETDAE